MAYEPSSFDYTDPQMQYSVDPSQFESQRTRPRESSNARGEANHSSYARSAQPHEPPLSEAVFSALGHTDSSTNVPPELIAQITESVIKQLKSSGLDNGTPAPPNQKPFPPPLPIHQPIPLSASTASTTSPPMHTRNAYTPPSPHCHRDYGGHGSPEPHSNTPHGAAISPRGSPTAQFKDRRVSSPFSPDTDSGYARPKGPTRLSTGRDETTLEKIWGQLFDEESNPTPRLGQFLRGLAMHIVCE